jgi:outer membrane lipoprotein SlyB
MIKKILLSSCITSLLVFSGCATNQGPEYDGNSYAQIKTIETGVVIKNKPVVISDNGTGKFLGAIIGAVVGSTFGSGNGSTLMALGGGVGGYYAGKEVGKANGNELTVELDDGRTVVVVVKGNKFKTGDRVEIIKDGNKVAQVDYAK